MEIFLNKEEKNLVEEVLMLFSRYEKRALRAFFRSAENEKIDVSEIDEKLEKIAEKSRRKKGLLNDIKNFYVKQFRFLKKILKLDAKEKEIYRRERLRLILKIENLRGLRKFDENTSEIFNMLEFYLEMEN